MALRTRPHFLDANYRGIGFRWGMGLDGSEQRLCEYRCLPLLDDMNNWVADKPTPPKYIQAISEVYEQGYGDDIYANNPVNYVKIDTLPPPGEWGPIVNAMEHGRVLRDVGRSADSVLLRRRHRQPSHHRGGRAVDVSAGVRGSGLGRRAAHGPADHLRHWTPGVRKPPFPDSVFDATGKKWVRFAAWDSAGNGAMVQPIKLAGRCRARALHGSHRRMAYRTYSLLAFLYCCARLEICRWRGAPSISLKRWQRIRFRICGRW